MRSFRICNYHYRTVASRGCGNHRRESSGTLFALKTLLTLNTLFSLDALQTLWSLNTLVALRALLAIRYGKGRCCCIAINNCVRVFLTIGNRSNNIGNTSPSRPLWTCFTLRSLLTLKSGSTSFTLRSLGTDRPLRTWSTLSQKDGLRSSTILNNAYHITRIGWHYGKCGNIARFFRIQGIRHTQQLLNACNTIIGSTIRINFRLQKKRPLTPVDISEIS